MFKKILFWAVALPVFFLLVFWVGLLNYVFAVMFGELQILGHRFEHWCYEDTDQEYLELTIKSIRSFY